MKFALLIHGLMFGAMLAGVPAQKPADVPSLANLRKAHEASLRAKQEALTKKQLTSLRALEKASVEQQDYEGAMRIVQVIAEVEKAAGAAAGRAGLVLDTKLPHACTNGAVEDGTRIHFTRTNAALRWEGVALKPGVYDVMITFAVGPEEESDSTRTPIYGGTVTFGEASNLSSVPPLKKVIVSTNKAVAKATVNLGRFQVNRERTDFTLKAISADQDGAMSLHEVALVPAVAGMESSEAELKALSALHEEYRKQLKDKTGAAQKYWLGKLHELEAQSKQSGNAAALALINPELALMQSKVEPGSTTEDAIVMSAIDPLLTVFKGEIRVANKGCLERLRPAGARVSFKLAAAKVKPGKYNVSLEMNLGGDMGGKYRLACGTSSLTGTIKGPDAYARRVIALDDSLVISSDATYLEFEVLELTSPTSSLGDLRSITLTPVKN